MSAAREAFLRRYATSPIHVARLERLLDAYGGDRSEETFARKVIDWDRACVDAEATRIVLEILSVTVDAAGRVRRFGDEVVQQSIQWMATHGDLSAADRAERLRAQLAGR